MCRLIIAGIIILIIGGALIPPAYFLTREMIVHTPTKCADADGEFVNGLSQRNHCFKVVDGELTDLFHE